MEHKKLNRIIAAVVFAISFVVYCATVAPTTSYWDCGEFIACSYIMGVPHPPGAPLFILLGRVFSMMPFVEDIGLRVNMISVLLSALTVMFTYLIGVRLIRAWRGVPETFEEKLIAYSGAVVGALGFAFTDSFWFNAVEAEVYAVSMFFTGIVVWLMLVWVEKSNEPAGDKILLLIMYLIGLAIGVHLLNVLALFSLAMIYYFNRQQLTLNALLGVGAGAIATFLVIYPGIVQGVPWLIKEFSFTFLGVVVIALVSGAVYALKNNERVMSLVLLSATLLLVGYSSYTALYIRSGMKPVINENHPDTPEKFVSYLNREQYGDIPLTTRRAPTWEYQIKKMYIRYFGWQFMGKGATLGPDGYIAETVSGRGLMFLPFILGMIGLVYHFKNDWKGASVIALLFIMTGVAIVIYLNQEDPQPRERDYSYVGSFFAFSIWIGLGASALMQLVVDNIPQSAALRKAAIGMTLLALFLAAPYNLLSTNYESHDRSGNYVAFDYSLNIMESCEPNAILFTNGDNDTFPLWFLQYVYGYRTDIRIVNLSLLNTGWYIKQLRDEEPKVPITISNEIVDKLQARLWKKKRTTSIPVARDIIIAELAKQADNSGLQPEDVADKPVFKFNMSHSKKISNQPVVLVQDLMVRHILRENGFRRPIYFAVTVAGSNMLGLGGRNGNPNFLRMDGLAFRIMPYAGPPDFISHKRIETNLFEKFQYRNLNNPDVFLNRNIKGLLQNYRSAFVRLASYYQGQKQSDKAVVVLDKMEEVMPEKVIPLRDYRLSLNFGRLYANAGRPDELERRLDAALVDFPLRATDKMFIAQSFSYELKNDDKAEQVTRAIVDQNPEYMQAYAWLVGQYTKTKQYVKGVEILEKWLVQRPGDRNAETQLASLKRLVAADTTSGGVETGVPTLEK